MQPENQNQTPQTEFQNHEVNPPKKPKTLIWAVVLILILLVAGTVAAYFALNLENKETEETENTNQVENQETTVDTSDWQTYRNEEFWFEFKYPKEWQLETAYKDYIESVKDYLSKYGTRNEDFWLVQVEDSLNGNGVGGPGGFRVSLIMQEGKIHEHTVGEALAQAQQKHEESKLKQGSFYGEPEIVEINGYQVVRQKLQPWEGLPYVYYVFPEKAIKISLSTSYYGGRLLTEEEQEVLISSFKFIDEKITENSVTIGDFTGYYTTFTKTAWEETAECDAFVVLNGHQALIEYFTDMVKRGNSVQHLDEQGRLIINLDFKNIEQSTVNTIKNSTELNLITLKLQKKIQPGKGAFACHSFFNILSAEE